MSRVSTVVLGCSVPLTGDEGVHGRHIRQAVELAAEQANRHRDLPFVLETVVYDDEADPRQAVAVAEKLAADARVLGVVGPMNSDPTRAAAPVYFAAGLAHISPSASNVALTHQGWNTFFRLAPHDLWQGVDGARYAVKVLGARRIAIVHDRSGFCEPLAEIFRETAGKLGAEIALYASLERGGSDYRDVAEQVRRTEPDLVYFGLIEAEGRVLARQMREAGVGAVYFGSDGLKPSHFLATPGAGVAGPYHTNAGTDVWVTPSAAPFVEAYRARYGEVYSIYTAEAYDSALVLIDAFARAERPDRPGVRDAVARTRGLAGATGSITFDEYGDICDPRIGIYRFETDRMVFLGYTRDLLKEEKV